MSFKSYDCYFVESRDPDQPFEMKNEYLGIDANGVVTIRAFCNPLKSGIAGSNDTPVGIDQDEFWEIFAFVILALALAHGIKVTRKLFGF